MKKVLRSASEKAGRVIVIVLFVITVLKIYAQVTNRRKITIALITIYSASPQPIEIELKRSIIISSSHALNIIWAFSFCPFEHKFLKPSMQLISLLNMVDDDDLKFK